MERSSIKPADHIASLPDGQREDIERLDASISKVMTGFPTTVWTGKFWGGTDQAIIGYGDFTYKGASGRTGEWFVVGLAAQKQHLSVYVNAVGGGGSLIKSYAERLGKVKVGSGVVSFRSLDDVDLDVLLELVGRAREQAPQPDPS